MRHGAYNVDEYNKYLQSRLVGNNQTWKDAIKISILPNTVNSRIEVKEGSEVELQENLWHNIVEFNEGTLKSSIYILHDSLNNVEIVNSLNIRINWYCQFSVNEKYFTTIFEFPNSNGQQINISTNSVIYCELLTKAYNEMTWTFKDDEG